MILINIIAKNGVQDMFRTSNKLTHVELKSIVSLNLS